MNRARRKLLREVLEKIDTMNVLIEEAKEDLQSIIDEEQEAFDNMPESLQSAERGEQMEEYIESMQEVLDCLEELDMDDAYQAIEGIVEG